MSSHDTEPRTSDRLRDEDLAAILAEVYPGGRAISVKFEPSPSKKKQYTGVHEFLLIEACDKNGVDPEKSKRTLRFYVKSLLPSNDTKLFVQECKYYGEIAPRLMQDFQSEAWAPRCYSARNGLLILEDLSVDGYETRHNKCLTPDDLTSAIRCLARMHAASFLLEARAKKPLIEEFPDFVGELAFPEGDIFWQWYLPSIETGEALATHLNLDPRRVAAAFKLMERKVGYDAASGKNVFCHFDLWRNNIMLKKSADADEEVSCRFVDFQKVVYNSYMINLLALVYLNATASPQDFEPYVWVYQEALESELRKHGYDEDRIIGREEMLRDLEDKRVFGHVTAVVYLPMVLLNSRTGQDFVADRQKYDYYLYKSRKELVFRIMKMDENYRVRVEQAVRDMCEFMERLEEKSGGE